MKEFLTSPIFKYCIFPIGSAALGIAMKIVTRNDQYSAYKKEDLAIGLDLMIAAILMFVVITTDRAVDLDKANYTLSSAIKSKVIDADVIAKAQIQQQDLSNQMVSAVWIILAMFIGLLGTSYLVRKLGWQSDTEMKPLFGIAIPLALGVAYLIFTMAGAPK